MPNQQHNVGLVALCLLSVAAGAALASIEHQPPVRVTHKNSGPSYDITNEAADNNKIPEVTSSKLAVTPGPAPADIAAMLASSLQAAGQPSSSNNNNQGESEGDAIGHLMIRRIFLVPIEPPKESLGESPAEQAAPSPFWMRRRHQQQPPVAPAGEAASDGIPAPLWSLMSPMRHQHQAENYPHLFGRDEASRSPPQVEGPSASGSMERPKFERPSEQAEREGPMRGEMGPMMMDPLQMMLNMMHHAINSAPMRPPGQDNMPTADDLSKEASSGDQEQPKAELEKSLVANNNNKKANQTNESREDVIEVEGKKYLRKMVVNKHVGDNMVFMTRRLIFVPLNETESTADKTTTSSSTTTTTTTAASDSTPALTSTERPRESSTITITKLLEPLSTSLSSEADQTTTATASTTAEASTPASTTTTSTTAAAPTSAKAAPEQASADKAKESVQTTTQKP